MKKHPSISLCLVAMLLTPQVAIASPLRTDLAANKQSTFEFVEVDCYAVGQDKAAELGGELAKATPETVDGIPVCKIVVLVAGKDGARPKRIEVDVPQ